MAYSELRGRVAIVGADEADEHGTLANKSVLQLHAEAALNAARDAGLKREDIDGVFTAGTQAATLAEYLGLRPRFIDGTSVGGCSFVIMMEHAMLALLHGMCDYALISHGESGRSRIGGARPPTDPATPQGQFEAPFGTFGAPTTFSLPLLRYMKETGTTMENLAEVVVATRKWAMLNPRALMRNPMTIEDVLSARTICYPLTRPMCCLVTDAAGAVILTTSERARDMPKRPVYLLGTGEAVTHQMVSQMPDFTWADSYEISGRRAFEMAGVNHEDVDFVEFYDAFVHTPIFALEALGFCPRGEGGRFVSSQRTAPGGTLPMNTNGGGLSYTHPGMYGMFIIVEAVRQLRGEAGERQVPDAHVGVVHGPGGMFSASGTAILANDIP